ncbi:zinc-binding dehydrogenase [Secundilactobacillus kimchicus]|uniref:zinc-binding dehydrogenase n=1 Tax=Secundilactobacillus kimchicus TaxID=528209 RepID=UPI0024A8D560|nr:zinc-binding dehydrogenase [Secundilactobacillus kimchicus]
MKALYFESFGGPEVLRYGDVADPNVKADTLLVKTTVIGLNFADIYRRRGHYHIEQHQPYIDGYEGIGIITAIGQAVSEYEVGERVLFVDVPFANAEVVAVPVDRAIRVPATLTDEEAVTVGLQGLTADFLAHDLAQNRSGDPVLVQGISGGVGQLLAQLLVADGQVVYGVASSATKAQAAYEIGAQQVFRREDDWSSTYQNYFRTAFDGAGVTLLDSLKVTQKRGRTVFYGMAGGNPPKVDPIALMKDSKNLMTGDLWDFLDSAKSRQARADRLFHYVLTQQVQAQPAKVYALAEGAQAHRDLEAGAYAGKLLLKP